MTPVTLLPAPSPRAVGPVTLHGRCWCGSENVVQWHDRDVLRLRQGQWLRVCSVGGLSHDRYGVA